MLTSNKYFQFRHLGFSNSLKIQQVNDKENHNQGGLDTRS